MFKKESFEKYFDLWKMFLDTEDELDQKREQCRDLPRNEQLLYMKDIVLKHYKLSNDLLRISQEEFSSMTFLEFVKIIGEKSLEIYAERFDILYTNFTESLSLAELFGKKREEILNEEALKLLDIFNNQKNVLLVNLGNESMGDLLPKVESYLDMLNIGQNANQNINDDFNRFINPIPNYLSTEELNQDLPFDDDIKLTDILQKIEESDEKFKLLIKSTAKELALLNCQKSYFDRIKTLRNSSEPEEEVHKNGKEFTLNRQVLAFHYLFKELNVNQVDTTEKARFVQFLTRRELGAKGIKNTNIYKLLNSPMKKIDSEMNKDLSFVREFFKKLNLQAIVNAITKEIDS